MRYIDSSLAFNWLLQTVYPWLTLMNYLLLFIYNTLLISCPIIIRSSALAVNFLYYTLFIATKLQSLEIVLEYEPNNIIFGSRNPYVDDEVCNTSLWHTDPSCRKRISTTTMFWSLRKSHRRQLSSDQWAGEPAQGVLSRWEAAGEQWQEEPIHGRPVAFHLWRVSYHSAWR